MQVIADPNWAETSDGYKHLSGVRIIKIPSSKKYYVKNPDGTTWKVKPTVRMQWVERELPKLKKFVEARHKQY